MTDDREVILKVENLRTWFPVKKGTFKKVVDHVKAVDDVSLEIYKGETLGIVGESGCGKSTFGKSIMRLEQITDGKVIFNYDGQFKDVAQFDKKEMFEFRKKVQMVFQDPTASFNPKMKIRDIICEPLLNFGRIKKSEKEENCRRLLELVELPEERLPEDPSPAQIEAALLKEAAAIRAKLPSGAALIALCVEGEPRSSEALARQMAAWASQGVGHLVFLIGGSFGLHPSIKAEARLRLSMSPMTFPHHLARVMVLEQIYRAYQINAGTKYHK